MQYVELINDEQNSVSSERGTFWNTFMALVLLACIPTAWYIGMILFVQALTSSAGAIID